MEIGPAVYVARGKQLRDDREVVLAAVQQDGAVLQFASERLRDDRDVVLAAVQQNGNALLFASPRFIFSRVVILVHIKIFILAPPQCSEVAVHHVVHDCSGQMKLFKSDTS